MNQRDVSRLDNKTLKSANNNVFALLAERFEDVPSDVIFNICTKCNWKLEDCIDNLQKSRNLANFAKSSISENDVDILVESEEVQNSIPNSKKVNELELNFGTIDLGSENMPNQPLSFAGAIKKTNRKFDNFVDTVDVPAEPIRFHDRPYIRDISNEILTGYKVMVIMRGPPGCGKSYLAREIIDASCPRRDYTNHIFTTDDFFYDQRGNYNFDPSQLGAAHQNNKSRVERYARDGWSPIFVDNTNIRVWEMTNYLEIAVRFGYLIHIVEPNTTWSRSAGKLAKKNSHNVPKETIERMMLNYELTNVKHALESNGLKYAMSMPQYRQFPPLKYEETIPNSDPNNEGSSSNNVLQQCGSKPQRASKHLPKISNLKRVGRIPDVVQYESLEEAFQHVDPANEWTAFEKERTQFWNTATSQLPQLLQSKPKEQRNLKAATTAKPLTNTKDEIHSNFFAILKENHETLENKSSTDEEPKEMLMLHKHRKNCRNENNSFAQIREIYPSVPLEVLWDLFEKCEGDGDWTMDILLKEETRVDDYEKSNSDRAMDDFECDCDSSNAPSRCTENSPVNISTYQRSTLPTRRDRSTMNCEEQLAAKRLIEESFQIGDEHYSEHTRKIRNLRRGVTSPAIVESTVIDDQEGACGIDIDEPEPNDDEILEINLGMDLVCQLDSVFGVEAYQREAIKDMKTNVFMPKSLAQQLYALWMESMYNQVEEQRKKSIKEDAEFARQLQSQQNYPGLYKHANPPSDMKDIMEMEYAWAAYKAEMDEWRLKTPQDLAQQMTHDKLCNIFPNVDRDTLIEVLAAHDNKFTETVDVLKDTLNGNAEDKILNEGRELFEEVRAEVELTTNDLKPSRPASIVSLENKKLGPEEAKRSALKEFEDSRNLAMRHTQLKAECYNKAKEAIQRGDTSVALYYSQVANLHKNKIDRYNNTAANCIMQVHNLTQNNPDMLDLHYLHVNEAVECLDLFLDKHITKLKTKPQTYKYIFVITGRGLHSANGISTIKQKVKNRFRERHLTWSEVNPGLLKVKIFINSRLTIHL